jgi:hypothetical protein
MINRSIAAGLALAALVQPVSAMDVKGQVDFEPLIAKHAAANNVPPALVHRIIIRESRYNARAVGRGGALGLMQIKHGTARALGYSGSADGLLDADTNLTYGVRYLAGAYRVAGGDQNLAVGYYARGYYYDAKRKGLLGSLARAPALAEEPVTVAAPPQPRQPKSIFSLLFSPPQAQVAVQQPAPAATAEPEIRVVTRARPRKAAITPPLQNAPQSTAQEVQPRAGSETPLPAAGRNRSNSRNLSSDASAGPGAPAAAESQALSGRSARPSAGAGADRSAQRASAQPGDPGKYP